MLGVISNLREVLGALVRLFQKSKKPEQRELFWLF